jgi:DnaK suppressor protein
VAVGKKASSSKARKGSRAKAGKATKPAKAARPAKAAKAPKPAKAAKPVKAAPVKAAPKPAPVDAKSGRKGITIVTPKPPKKVKVPVTAASIMPPGVTPLLDPKSPHRRPLIPSGPKAAVGRALGQHGGPDKDEPRPVVRTHLSPEELEHFKGLLLKKRQVLVGDVAAMEKQALQGESGSLSNMPSHLAEQGSDASEQSLSLDLAAADRKLIREIDDALARIEQGTYGVCEISGKPIKQERLEELPWARYSIEAAREIERHAMKA